MIKLTRLNGQRIVLNQDAILWAEQSPDTTLHLSSGESFIVLETIEELVEQVVTFRRRIASTAVPARSDVEPSADG